MKKKIHPKYYKEATVHCACGNTFKVGSTKEFIEIEICSQCHPFYTGKEKVVDTLGRIEKFKKRLSQKQDFKKKSEKHSRKNKTNKKTDKKSKKLSNK